MLPIHTERLTICDWSPRDFPSARRLWGDSEVMQLLDGRDGLSDAEVMAELNQQIRLQAEFDFSFWKVIHRSTFEFIGCCGLRPTAPQGEPESKAPLEVSVHILSKRWGSGYATEAGWAVMNYAFHYLGQEILWARHHPDNLASRHLLLKSAFVPVGERIYPPTGVLHPAYELSLEQFDTVPCPVIQKGDA